MIFVLYIVGLFSGPSYAFETVPNQIGDFNDVIFPGQNISQSQRKVQESDARIVMRVNCYATNLRSVSNPIAPNSQIYATLQLKSRNITIGFPGSLTDKNNPSTHGTAQGVTVSGGLPTPIVSGRTITVIVPNHLKKQMLETVSVNEKGEITQAIDVVKRDSLAVKGLSFRQEGVQGGKYYARTGTLTNVNRSIKVSNDGQVVKIKADFPGQQGFCGGWYSPLMVFFDDKRPEFKHISNFPLNDGGIQTHWPEPNSAGYFLAIDRDKNGVIDKRNELFGDNVADQNGFSALSREDTNSDGKITAEDQLFSQLVLWKDKNGDGKGTQDEMAPLRQYGLKAISLKYSNHIVDYGKRAREKQRSIATYETKSGEIKQADVIDLWFAPYIRESLASNE